jgi:pimeloyl-ACP methyl ester carboxylesterase
MTVRKADPLRTADGIVATLGNQSAGVAQTMSDAVRAQRGGQADRAAGLYLRAIEKLKGAASAEALEAGRFATARLVELCTPRIVNEPNRGTLTFAALDGGPYGYRVSLRRGAGRAGVGPEKFVHLEAADRFTVSSATGISRQAGAGAALVGHLQPVAPFQSDVVKARSITGLHWAVTAVPVFGPVRGGMRTVTLELYDPGVAPALAADFTLPLAVTNTCKDERHLGLAAFTRGESYFGNSGLYPTEPPSPDKTPLVLVHGLVSDPGTFYQLANALRREPDLRRRYQIWVFFYPTSLPVLASAALLRESLAQQIHELDPAGRHPALHRAVLVGHSMGGLLSRLTVSDSAGDTFYRHYFQQPFHKLNVDPAARERLRQVFYFHAEPAVSTVVFIATPHRGSQLAVSPLGGLGRRLAGLPQTMKKTLQTLGSGPGVAKARVKLRNENSVFGLNPGSTLIQALDSSPLPTDRVQFHSIIGNRGRRGPPGKSSDGAVPYQSSHLPQVRREIIVPAGHSSILINPITHAEVVKILREAASRQLLDAPNITENHRK